MTLKEAFTYQNQLSSALNSVISCLNNSAYITETKRIHHKKKANKDAEDLTEIVTVQKSYDCSANNLLTLMKSIIVEKELCAKAISQAKKNLPYDIDDLVSNNKTMQEVSRTLKTLAEKKPTEQETRGTDYCFNNDGNQTQYYYTIDESVSIDYDRNIVKSIYKDYITKTQENSKKVDEAMITVAIDFIPKWDITDTFEDMIESVK